MIAYRCRLGLTLAALIFGTTGTRSLDVADVQKPEHRAVKPKFDPTGWLALHESYVKRAKKGNVDVVFLGDSITQQWDNNGKTVWQERLEPLKAVNFGMSGNCTHDLFWRITEGKELEGIQPKAVVLLIGTNNLANNTNREIVSGITALVKELNRQQPHAKVLLLGIFPRGAKATDKNRARIKEINEKIARLDDGKRVRYLDFGARFLDANRDLARDDTMYDGVHLTTKGYTIWADAIKEPLDDILRQ
jgi:lysophospholipase L1-like esterase